MNDKKLSEYLDDRDARVRSAERERCASVAEHLNAWGSSTIAENRAAELAAHIAHVIRKLPD